LGSEQRFTRTCRILMQPLKRAPIARRIDVSLPSISSIEPKVSKCASEALVAQILF
jgi:hypothetical protein